MTNTFKDLSEEETRACIRFFMKYGKHVAPAMPLVMAWADFWEAQWKRLWSLHL